MKGRCMIKRQQANNRMPKRTARMPEKLRETNTLSCCHCTRRVDFPCPSLAAVPFPLAHQSSMKQHTYASTTLDRLWELAWHKRYRQVRRIRIQ